MCAPALDAIRVDYDHFDGWAFGERNQILSRQARLVALAGDTRSALSELDRARGKTIRFVLSLENTSALARAWRQTLCERLVEVSTRDQPAVSGIVDASFRTNSQRTQASKPSAANSAVRTSGHRRSGSEAM